MSLFYFIPVTSMNSTLFDLGIPGNRQKTYFDLGKNLKGTRFITYIRKMVREEF
jgi:hypothetical protein